jgi:GTP-binding protein
LLNSILGEDRVIVDPTPGTTRDAIDTVFEHEGERIVLIDTAGVRRRGRIEGGVERYSVLRSLRAISRADIVLLVLDAMEMVTAQDMHIAGYVQQAYKGMVVVVNKWDLMREKGTDDTEGAASMVFQHLRFMPYAPVVFTSALLAEGMQEVLGGVKSVAQAFRARVKETDLSEAFHAALVAHPPPKSGTKQLKIYSVSQEDVSPPTFVFEVNEAPLVHFSYKRFLENRLRNALNLDGTPLRLMFMERERAGRRRRGDS